jgi:hypothetical protein
MAASDVPGGSSYSDSTLCKMSVHCLLFALFCNTKLVLMFGLFYNTKLILRLDEVL